MTMETLYEKKLSMEKWDGSDETGGGIKRRHQGSREKNPLEA